jgi:hypothetical protein
VLFLGLGFDTPHVDVIQTASPAKLPEYMASGRPILVHAPRGSHVAEYAREEGFAEVVDAPDDEALRAAVTRVLSDRASGEARVGRAQALVRGTHELSRVREELGRLLESLL